MSLFGHVGHIRREPNLPQRPLALKVFLRGGQPSHTDGYRVLIMSHWNEPEVLRGEESNLRQRAYETPR